MKHIHSLIVLVLFYSSGTNAVVLDPADCDKSLVHPKAHLLDTQKEMRNEILDKALFFHQCFAKHFTNKRYIAIVDYKLHSGEKRFYVVDLEKETIKSYLTAHGRGSDPDHTGYAKSFSDEPDSLASSLGYFKTAEIYTGANGKSLSLDGLSSTNQNARKRRVVVHAADYVEATRKKMGRSHGCPALEAGVLDEVVERIKGGSLFVTFD